MAAGGRGPRRPEGPSSQGQAEGPASRAPRPRRGGAGALSARWEPTPRSAAGPSGREEDAARPERGAPGPRPPLLRYIVARRPRSAGPVTRHRAVERPIALRRSLQHPGPTRVTE